MIKDVDLTFEKRLNSICGEMKRIEFEVVCGGSALELEDGLPSTSNGKTFTVRTYSVDGVRRSRVTLVTEQGTSTM